VPGALCVAIFGTACSQKTAAQPEVVRPVRTMIVAAGEENVERSFPGRIEASRQVELAFQVSGLLVELPVREGQTVAKGDVIARLRQNEFEARLTALKGQLDRARADLQALRSGVRPEERLRLESQVRAAESRLVNARRESERASRAVQTRAISRLEYDRFMTAYSVAREEYQAAVQTLEQSARGREEDILAKEADVRGLEARVVEAKIELDDATLRAPYGGIIAQRFVEERQNVTARQPIVKFQDAVEIEIAMDVPESVMAADLRSADIVQLIAEFSAAPGLQFPVRITEIAQRADPVTQTFTVRAAMQPPPGVSLLPGMTATVRMTYRRAGVLGSGVLVPASAVLRDAGGEQVVWVIGSDQSVSRRPVQLGEATGGSIEVVSGLQPGDRIAVAGVTFLRDGMKVRDLGDALTAGPL
jgi:multidrug efflux system membrane fusion protein